MKRSCTPTWIDGNGGVRAFRRMRLNERELSEAFLQETLHACPTLLPIEEFDAEFGPLLSLGREVDCIDNLFISPAGRLTLVETKLWRNPESVRTVIAQILEYAVRVSHWSYEDLEKGVRQAFASPLGPGMSLHDLVRSTFPEETPDAAEFHDAVQKTLHTGRFLLLVVGDGIREGLESLLASLHAHPRMFFTFGLVELRVFADPGSPGDRLIVPQILANSVEIVRAVVRVEGQANVTVEIDDTRESGGGTTYRRALSEEEFFERIEDRSKVETVRELFARVRDLGAVLEPRKSGISVRLPDPAGSKQRLTLFVVTGDLEIYTGWLPDQLERIGGDRAIARGWVGRLTQLFEGVERHPVYPESDLSRRIAVDEIEPVLDDFIANLRAVIEAIKISVA